MTSRVGTKGQVVIPKPLRDRLGLAPGDEVDFWLDDDVVRLAPVRSVHDLRGRFRGRRLVEALEEDRRRERDR